MAENYGVTTGIPDVAAMATGLNMVDEAEEREVITLTPEEEAEVQKTTVMIISNINLGDINKTEQFIANFGGTALAGVKAASVGAIAGAQIKDLDEASKVILGLDKQVGEFKAFILAKKVYRNIKAEIAAFTKKYQPIEKYINSIEKDLDRYILRFDKEIGGYAARYEAMDKAYRVLLVLVEAGNRALKTMRDVELPKLKHTAKYMASIDNVEKADQYENFCDDFAATVASLTNSRTDAFRARPSINAQRRAKRIVWNTLKNQRDQAIPLLLNSIADVLTLSTTKAAMELSSKTTKSSTELRELAARTTAEVGVAVEQHRGETISQVAKSIVLAIDTYIAGEEKARAEREKTREVLIASEAELKAAEQRLIDSMNK